MRRVFLVVLLSLIASRCAHAQTGYITRADCGTATGVTNNTTCKQTTTANGRVAGQVYNWNGSAWVNHGAASLPNLTSNGAVTTSGSNGTLGTTSVTSTNTPSSIVQRDGSGNFSAGTMTGNVTGDVTGNVSGNATATLSTLNSHAADRSLHGIEPIIKESDEAVTSSTTLQNDDHLSTISMAASEHWLWTWTIFYNGGSTGASDLKIAFSVPALATGIWGVHCGTAPAMLNIVKTGFGDSNTAVCETNGATTPLMAVIKMTIFNAGTPGAVTLRWAQNFSSATATTVMQNSMIEGREQIP